MAMNDLIRFFTLTVVLVLEPGIVTLGNTNTTVDTVLPEELLGWLSKSADRVVYTGDTLYDYIDGGAELYLSYGFRRLVSARYVRLGEPDIVVDLFDMGSSQNAFGVFSQSREVVESEFGQGSQYTEGLLLFWKGPYYVSVLSSPETKLSKQAVFELARKIEKALPEEGPLPDVLSLLPRENLIEESIRYFRHYIWLNSHYYVADENILHIDETTAAVLAKYRSSEARRGERQILLVVQYLDEAKASAAYEEFLGHYMPERSDDAAVQIEDGTWTACRSEGDVVAVVFNGQSKESALRLVGAVLDLNRR